MTKGIFARRLSGQTVLAAAALSMALSATAEERDPLRCLIFYSNMKGVNSVIAQAAEEMETELSGDDRISLSAYELSSDVYDSLDYKVDIAVDLEMDVLILSGAAAGESEGFRKLEEAGIKLILIDGDVEESGRCAYVGTDNIEGGRQGARLFRQWADQCVVGILSSPVTSSNLNSSRQERMEGFLLETEAANEEMEEKFPFQIEAKMECSLDNREAVAQVADLLRENDQINGLFCLDSASGIAAAQAVEELGKTETIYVVCFDMPGQVEEEMEKGGIDAVLVQDAQECGKRCAAILRELYETPECVKNRRDMVACEIVTVP